MSNELQNAPAAPATPVSCQTPRFGNDSPLAGQLAARKAERKNEAAAAAARNVVLQDRLAACVAKLTPKQQRAAELYVVYRNKVQAWREAYEHKGRGNARDYASACEILNKPSVLAYIRELEAVAAASIQLDIAALLDADRRIVEAAEHANDIARITYTACRRCFGVEHKYQWIDLGEYLEAVTKVQAQNEERTERKVRLLPEPDDTGGFGYDPSAEPNIACPACEGAGQMRTLFADTTKLGPAQPLYRSAHSQPPSKLRCTSAPT